MPPRGRRSARRSKDSVNRQFGYPGPRPGRAFVGPMILHLGKTIPDGGEHAIGVEQLAYGGFRFPS